VHSMSFSERVKTRQPERIKAETGPASPKQAGKGQSNH